MLIDRDILRRISVVVLVQQKLATALEMHQSVMICLNRHCEGIPSRGHHDLLPLRPHKGGRKVKLRAIRARK